MSALNFTPCLALTQTISATAVSSSITLTAVGSNATQMLLTNQGPNTAFFRYGDGAQTAVATTDTPILAGATIVFNTGSAPNTVAAICAATQTATLFVTPGYGE